MTGTYYGRCAVCDCRASGEFCYVHEPYSGASRQAISRARDEHQIERAREQRECVAVPAAELIPARDEWAGGDGGLALTRRVLIARSKAGLPCDTEALALTDAYWAAVDAARTYLTSPPGTPYPAILGGDE